MPKLGRYSIPVAIAALLLAGGATAAVLVHTIILKPGHCRTVSRSLKVCAAKQAAAHTVTVTQLKTTTVTLTVSPSPVGKTFSGDGDTTLAPFTLAQGVNLSWTAQPDQYGDNVFEIDSGPNDPPFECDNGDGTATSGTAYIGPGTYTLSVSASSTWTISF